MTFEFDGFQELHDFLTTGGKEIKNDFIPEFKRHVGNINKETCSYRSGLAKTSTYHKSRYSAVTQMTWYASVLHDVW